MPFSSEEAPLPPTKKGSKEKRILSTHLLDLASVIVLFPSAGFQMSHPQTNNVVLNRLDPSAESKASKFQRAKFILVGLH